MVDCSRSEAATLTPPRDLAELDLPSLDVLGWRDPEAELRGHLLHEQQDGVAGRNGNTVGTCICADLDCPGRVLAVPRSAQHLDEELHELAVAEQVEGLRQRLRRFTADVLRG
jgi:FBP C-terminal treble-clef zinc-finger